MFLAYRRTTLMSTAIEPQLLDIRGATRLALDATEAVAATRFGDWQIATRVEAIVPQGV